MNWSCSCGGSGFASEDEEKRCANGAFVGNVMGWRPMVQPRGLLVTIGVAEAAWDGETSGKRD